MSVTCLSAAMNCGETINTPLQPLLLMLADNSHDDGQLAINIEHYASSLECGPQEIISQVRELMAKGFLCRTDDWVGKRPIYKLSIDRLWDTRMTATLPPEFYVEKERPVKLSTLRDKVFRRDSFTCLYCRQPSEVLHADHVVPKSKGGKTELNNLVTACHDCNTRKRDMMPLDFIWRMVGNQ